MVNVYEKKIRHSWHRPFWVFTVMLMANLAANALATDLDFAKRELEQAGRTRLSRLPNEQRQAINLLDRYLRQKSAQKKVPPPVLAPVPSPVSPESANAPVSDTSAAENLPVPYSLSQNDCELMLADVVAKKHVAGTILMAQRQLTELGFILIEDGVLGKETRSKLMQFCESAQFALSNQLLDMLQNHLSIYKRYPDWKQILASGGFERWAVRQSDHDEIGKMRQLGNSTEVIVLLERYKQRNATISGSRPDDFLVSYALTKEDFKQFKSTSEIFKLTEKLRGESYVSKAEFDAALETAFSGVADSKRYMDIAKEYAEQQSGLTLSEKSFENLKVRNIPAYVLQSIQDLKDLNYPDTEINSALETVIDDLAAQVNKFKADDIVKLAEIWPAGARLTDESLKKFSETQKKDDQIAAAILGKLQKIKKVEYQNTKAMAWAVKKILRQVVDEINNSVPVIIGEAEETTGYSLSEDSMQKINERMKDFAVPEIYLEMLSDMQDVDYPDPDLFWLAAKAKVAMVGYDNILRTAIFGALERQSAKKVDESLLGKLKEVKLSPAVLAQIGTLQGQKFEDTKALEDEINNLFMQLSEQFVPFRPLVVAQARKMHPFDKTKKIQWSGAKCNCVNSNLSGDVYGFYPYWMAGEKQVIDFSVLTRVGYYGLNFDDKGNIANASRWSDLDTGFIREAQTYGTKVDLVIYRNDWRTWNQTTSVEKEVAFDNLAMNIVGLVVTPLADPFSRMKPYISLGTSSAPIMGDGVTLYFDGYPQDKVSVDAFNVFIRTLRDLFEAQGRRSFVNIMFRSSDMGKGIYDHQKLLDILNTLKDHKLNGRLLVLLQEPTLTDKKLLRANIENGVRGQDRLKLLRNIVSVITFDGRSDVQMTNDVIFAEDNFGGIGFWPHAVAAESSVTDNAVNAALQKNYQNNVKGGIAQNSEACRYICPNRWAFRIAWEFFVIVLMACVFLYFKTCEYRNFMEKYFIHIIVGVVMPEFLLGMALLTCDPAWAEISRGNGPLVLVMVAIIAYAIWNYRNKKKDAYLP